jgi:hypothetical protein
MARKMGSLELVQFPWASKACGAKVTATAMAIFSDAADRNRPEGNACRSQTAKASGTLDMISPTARISAARVRAG